MNIQVKYQCEYSELVQVGQLRPHPKNPNKHSKEQIARLAEIIKYQGFRSPIIVSRLSGFIVAGHGRLEAAKHLGLLEVPVDYQEFESEAQEYAHIVADNAIAEWAELDLSSINTDVGDLGPDFDVDLLGLKKFEIDPADKNEKQNKISLSLEFANKELANELRLELQDRGFTVKSKGL